MHYEQLQKFSAGVTGHNNPWKQRMNKMRKKYSTAYFMTVVSILFILSAVQCKKKDSGLPFLLFSALFQNNSETISAGSISQVEITHTGGSAPVTGTFTINADVSMDIVRVEFYIDGQILFDDLTSPFEYSFDSTQYCMEAVHQLKAIGYTASGEATQSQTEITIGDNFPGKLAYFSQTDITGVWNGTSSESLNIWVSDLDGARVALTKNTIINLNSGEMSLSADHSKVLFSSRTAIDGSWDDPDNYHTCKGYNIFIANSDGTGLTALTKNDIPAFGYAIPCAVNSRKPSFSPDSSEIIFSSDTPLDGSWTPFQSGKPDNIWIMKADGSNRVALTQNSLYLSGLDSDFPVFSPDGSKVAFRSTTALDGTWDGVKAGMNIWIVNSDGTGLTPLTSYNGILMGDAAFVPVFSPDGTKIVFAAPARLDGSWASPDVLSNNIWIVDSTGASPPLALTRNSAADLGSLSPEFSADGNQVIFKSRTSLDGTWDGSPAPENLWIVNLDGSNLNPLSKNTHIDHFTTSMEISDSFVVFDSNTALSKNWSDPLSAINLWRVNLDGSGLVSLTHNTIHDWNAYSTEPVLTGSGNRIGFYSHTSLDQSWNPAGNVSSNMWHMRTDGSCMKPLTENTMNESGFSLDSFW